MRACYEVFLAVEHGIQSATSSPESDLATIDERCDIYAGLLDELTSMGISTVRFVDILQCRIKKELSYPPGIHFLMMHALGPIFWQEREVALTEVPPILDVVRQDIKGIAALVAELKTHTQSMRERFSVLQLGQIKALPDQVRYDLKVLVELSLDGLPSWASTVRVHGSCILKNIPKLNPFDATLDAAATIRANTRQIYSRFGPYVSLVASAQSSTAPKCAFMHETAKALGAYVAEVAYLTGTLSLLFCAVMDAMQFNTDDLEPWLDTIASEYEILVAHVDTLRAQGAALSSALDSLERAVKDALGYYPGAHFLIFSIASPAVQLFDMGDYATAREAALRATPIELESWRALIRENDEIVRTLELSAEEARRRFSVCTLIYIRGRCSEERRWQVIAMIWMIRGGLQWDAEDLDGAAKTLRMEGGSNWRFLWVH
ncbi:hypothetical protein EV714DRAFT_268747 [Schizophyllum commune]